MFRHVEIKIRRRKGGKNEKKRKKRKEKATTKKACIIVSSLRRRRRKKNCKSADNLVAGVSLALAKQRIAKMADFDRLYFIR